MDRYIIKVLFYAKQVKFEQVLGFLPSLGKKSTTLFPKKNNQGLIRNFGKKRFGLRFLPQKY
jgi:hypothetical protein